ncbi:serine proteinase inhibitor, partial [Necator americanus]
MILAAETDFGLKLLQQPPVMQPSVVSPLSVLFALAMVQIGSKGNTKTQINNVISHGRSDENTIGYYSRLAKEVGKTGDDGLQSLVANGFFIKSSIILLAMLRKEESRQWLMKERSEVFFFRKLLKNSLYLEKKGVWKDKFSRKKSFMAKFFKTPQRTKRIRFMNAYNVRRSYTENDDMQVLSLAYTDPTYAMNIFLPKKRFGLRELLHNLNGTTIQNLLSQLKNTSVTITVPTMKLNKNVELKESLMAMGVIDLFSENADLSGITKTRNLKISDATHRALIEMNEELTTAAGATS